jgi:hypothetical protein
MALFYFSRPLRDDEKLPVRQHRVVSILSTENGEQAGTAKKKHRKDRHHHKETKTEKKVRHVVPYQCLACKNRPTRIDIVL